MSGVGLAVAAELAERGFPLVQFLLAHGERNRRRWDGGADGARHDHVGVGELAERVRQLPTVLFSDPPASAYVSERIALGDVATLVRFLAAQSDRTLRSAAARAATALERSPPDGPRGAWASELAGAAIAANAEAIAAIRARVDARRVRRKRALSPRAGDDEHAQNGEQQHVRQEQRVDGGR